MDDASQALQDAIDDGDVAALGRLLAADRALANRRDEGGLTPLMRVLMGIDRDPRMIEALLAAGADPNATTEDGETALHLIVDVEGDGGFGDEPVQLARPLVDAGAELEARQAEGLTPLQFAVVHGTPDEVAALARLGARVDRCLPADFDPAGFAGLTPLAAALGSSAKVEALLAAGADAAQTDASGRTAVEHCHARREAAEAAGDDDLARALGACAELLAR
ncbi:ankyrin repeat domain-containing protein [Engelhardtia mirabilis]